RAARPLARAARGARRRSPRAARAALRPDGQPVRQPVCRARRARGGRLADRGTRPEPVRRAARLLACLAGVACAGLGAHAQLATRDEPLDLRITGGRIVDGTGNPWFHGDVGVRDGRIVAVGRVDAPAVRVVDASGLVVAPGFVDIHNHSDASIVADPNAESMVRQGVTTMVFGEGGSAAPSERWPRLADYFETLETQGISLNVGTYVGSSQVWTAVHGDREGPPSADAMTRMRAIVAQAMRDGALGVSSSLSGPPGVWIDTDTLVAMCEEAARFGGRYSTHMRTEGLGVFEAVDEALEIGRRAGVPVDIIHLKIAEHTMWGRMPELLSRIADARARGQQVEAHVYPYRAGQNNLVSIVPPWAHEGGTAAMLDRLRDPALRPRLRDEILGRREIPGWYNHYTATGSWEGM